MRKLYSLLLFTITVLSFALAPTKAKASHAAGGEIIYEWISDSTYRIYFKFYRDCTGIDAPDNQPLCISNSCGIIGGTGSFTIDKWTGALPGGNRNGDPVSAGCSQYKNKCDSPNSAIPGYREWWYYYLWTSGGGCTNWNFSTSVSARNSSNNITATNLYVETTLDNYHFEGNSSPFFSIKPIPYVCINQPFTYNNGAIDPDGDSIASEMIIPFDGGCGGPASASGWVGATPPFNVTTNPLQTNNTFSLNALSGQMIFTASQGGASTITTKVSEYYTNPTKTTQNNPKLGSLIGYIMRDIQVQVLSCTTVAPNFVELPLSIVGGGYVNNMVNGCLGQDLDFDFYVKATKPTAVLTIEDNHQYSIPTAQLTYTNLQHDSLHGHFHWTPTSIGLKRLIVTTKDSTCEPPGIMLYYPTSVLVYIWGPVKASPDTAVCPLDAAFLNATGGQNYQWSVLPGGGPITQLNNPNIYNPVSITKQRTTYVVVSTLNAFCKNSSDTVTVDVLPGLNFTKMPDTVTCPDNPVKLDLKAAPPAGVKYLYKWTPSTYLDDSTKPSPTSTPKVSTTYYALISSNANQCKGYDTINVDVLTGFKIDNPDTAICQGQTVAVRGSGDNRYRTHWTSDGMISGIYDNPDILTPIITPGKIGKDRYIVTLSKPGCRDTSVAFRIDMQPVPIVTVDQDYSTCFGDTIQLNGVVTPAGYPFDLTWTPGSSLTNPKIPNPIFSANQSGKLTLTATTTAGCTSSDDLNITVFPSVFLFTSNDTAICPGGAAQLHVSGNGVKTFRWTPDINISNTFSYDPIVAPPVTQEYKVYAVDTNFCSDTQSIKVTVYPKATMELPDSVRIYPGDSYQMQPGGNCSFYTWFPPLGLSSTSISNPVAQPEVNTRYFVTGITEAGCAVSDSISVMVSTESILDVPNGFVPGSSTSGKFRILHMGMATLKNFSIYNRWGVKVFETTDLNEGWDGSFKNDPQPMGVYIYTIEAVTPSGHKFTKQGNVTLVR